MNCRQASRLLSEALDHRLRPADRLRLRLHLLMCTGCTRFGRQVRFMQRASRQYIPGGAKPGKPD
ncbi:zf-HC2 domain-containing protein [Paludibacterium yongneupense]|uniref:anti-sigma factor family protein n=1 Tax=Paludibacterium yongneupense TaxID=400061 RepID=UPI00048EBA8A|nr:zf-HC2 domain-containing protein [Paludibacterium yongneupense]